MTNLSVYTPYTEHSIADDVYLLVRYCDDECTSSIVGADGGIYPGLSSLGCVYSIFPC